MLIEANVAALYGDPQALVKELKLYEFGYPKYYATDLRSLAIILSSLLPKLSESSLSEIDDIIYENDPTEDVAGTKVASEDVVEYLVENCFSAIQKIMISLRLLDRQMVTLLIQLLERVSDKTFEEKFNNPFAEDKNIIRSLARCSIFDDVSVNVCNNSNDTIIKILIVILEKHPKFIMNQIRESKISSDDMQYLISLLWLRPSHYEVRNPITRRRACWLLEQLECRHIHLRNFLDIKESHETPGDYDSEFIRLLTHSLKGTYNNLSFFIKRLYSYFLSATSDDQKIRRIEDFIDGFCLKEFKCSRSSSPKDFLSKFIMYCKYIVKYIFTLYLTIQRFPTIGIIHFQSSFEYTFNSYLTKHYKCSSYVAFKEETGKLIDRYSTKSSKTNLTPINRNIEEFAPSTGRENIFHKFILGLQILDILHTTWLLLDDLVANDILHPRDFGEVHDFPNGFISEVFRPRNSPFIKRMNEIISKSSQNGRDVWWIQILLKNCTFLLLRHDDDSYLIDLVKLLKGVNIGTEVKEKLHFVLNSHNKEFCIY